MSKAISPTAIGGFTLGAIALLITGLLVFGGGQAFNRDKASFVVFFESSLNGLNIGAPVKMQGVKIGEVKDIALLFDDKSGKLFKPVVIEINRSLLNDSNSATIQDIANRDQLKTHRDRLVADGFRARLEMQSLLTGLLFVDLDEHPNKAPIFANLEYQNLLEIPGIPATSEELRNTAEEVAQKLRSLPLDQIVQDLASSLREIKTILASEDIKKSKIALANTLEEVEKTVKILNSKLDPLLTNTNNTMTNAGALLEDTRAAINQLHKDMGPLLVNTDKTLLAATSALNRADQSLQKIGDAVGPESALTDSLQAVKDAARAIRDLGDYLEQHPEALLSGKNH
jgi:paraquat-inducible protein B